MVAGGRGQPQRRQAIALWSRPHDWVRLYRAYEILRSRVDILHAGWAWKGRADASGGDRGGIWWLLALFAHIGSLVDLVAHPVLTADRETRDARKGRRTVEGRR